MAGGLPHRVSDARATRHELIENAVSAIGSSLLKRRVFGAIYYHKSRIKSADQVAKMAKLPRIRVLQVANALAGRQLFGKVFRKGEQIAYEQDPIYQSVKQEIFRQLDSRERRESFPTRRTPKASIVVTVRQSKRAVKASFITVDDIESFQKVRRIKFVARSMPLSEERFKLGLQRIIGEDGVFKDWGGEQNDLFSTWLRLDGKRRRVAFALKGPGARGKMTLRHLGKNADQIQRLFKSPADIFLVQHHDEIDQMVVGEMQTHARDLARKEERLVWYGVIDGKDSRRLVAAYSDAFR